MSTVQQIEGGARQRQGEHTRRQILDAAVYAFARSGYEAASLADVASRADVKKALVQYHFSTKLDLWQAAAKSVWQQRNRHLQAVIARSSARSPKQAMRDGFKAVIEFSLENPQWLWFMFHEAAAGGARQDWLLEHCIAGDYLIGETFVREFQAQGLIRPGSPLQLLHLISGALTYNLLVAPTTLQATGTDLASREAIDEQVTLLQALLHP